jgi:hypothetical protein
MVPRVVGRLRRPFSCMLQLGQARLFGLRHAALSPPAPPRSPHSHPHPVSSGWSAAATVVRPLRRIVAAHARARGGW